MVASLFSFLIEALLGAALLRLHPSHWFYFKAALRGSYPFINAFLWVPVLLVKANYKGNMTYSHWFLFKAVFEAILVPEKRISS